MIGTNIFFALLFYSLSLYWGSKKRLPDIKIEKQISAYNFKKSIAKHTTFGQQRLISSFLWMQTLMESDLEHYKGADLNSWMYLRIDHITDLDQKFLAAYQFGIQYLSVVKDDIKGATSILEKGLLIYPNDFILNLAGGFHYLNEEENFKRALELLTRTQRYKNAPPFIPSLIAKLKAEEGYLHDSFQFLMYLYENADENTHYKKKYEKDLYALKAQIDLDCLNNNHTNCSLKDFYGKQYQKINDKYQAIHPWEKLKIFKKN